MKTCLSLHLALRILPINTMIYPQCENESSYELWALAVNNASADDSGNSEVNKFYDRVGDEDK